MGVDFKGGPFALRQSETVEGKFPPLDIAEISIIIKNMGFIIKEIEISGDKGSEIVSALFDTGSSTSLIRKDIVNRVSTAPKLPRSIEFELGDGGKMGTSEVCVLIIGINS
jgi:hypothetical protein